MHIQPAKYCITAFDPPHWRTSDSWAGHSSDSSVQQIYGLIVCNLAMFGVTWLDQKLDRSSSNRKNPWVCGKMVV